MAEGENAARGLSPWTLLDPHLRRVVLTIGYMLIAAGTIIALNVVWPLLRQAIEILLPFLVALIFAYILNPIVNFLSERLKLQRFGGLIAFYVLLVLFIAVLLIIVVPILYQQIRAAVEGITVTIPARVNEYLIAHGLDADGVWKELRDFLAMHGFNLDELVGQAARSDTAATAARQAASGGVAAIGGIFGFVLRTIGGVFSSIAFLSFVILISFYLVMDFAKLRGIMEVIVPDRYEDRFFTVLRKCDEAVGGFLRGQLISALLVGALVFLALLGLGLGKYALLIAVIAVFGNLVPYLGPILSGAPAVLYMLLSDRFAAWDDKLLWAAITAGAFIVIQQIDGFVFQPKIVGKRAQLHPVVVLVALVAGSNFGIMGMIVAVPLASVIRVLFKEFFWDKREAEWRAKEGNAPAPANG